MNQKVFYFYHFGEVFGNTTKIRIQRETEYFG